MIFFISCDRFFLVLENTKDKDILESELELSEINEVAKLIGLILVKEVLRIGKTTNFNKHLIIDVEPVLECI